MTKINKFNSPDSTGKGAEATKKKGFLRRHPVLTVILLGILAVATDHLWQELKMKNQKEDVAQRVDSLLLAKDIDMLREICKPLVWSIRADMMRENMEQLNILIADLVKEKHFQFIHLVDPSGKIILSTDKKLEGQSAEGQIESSLLHTDSIQIISNNPDPDLMIAGAPVMGYDKRLGTLIIGYGKTKFAD